MLHILVGHVGPPSYSSPRHTPHPHTHRTHTHTFTHTASPMDLIHPVVFHAMPHPSVWSAMWCIPLNSAIPGHATGPTGLGIAGRRGSGWGCPGTQRTHAGYFTQTAAWHMAHCICCRPPHWDGAATPSAVQAAHAPQAAPILSLCHSPHVLLCLPFPTCFRRCGPPPPQLGEETKSPCLFRVLDGVSANSFTPSVHGFLGTKQTGLPSVCMEGNHTARPSSRSSPATCLDGWAATPVIL